MSANSLDVQPVAANHRLECIVGSMALGNEQLGVALVADARREPESQKVHQAEHMIGEARRVGVVIQRVDVQKQALFCLPLDVETDMPPCRKLNINTQLPTHCFHVTLHGG
ncbi:hypothetical protein VCSRO82_3484 [Vibrio cholerae]|nr:hypothetical protein VCSRO82_3484 [Vibrio cholerae]